jgi:hypothetical protein
MSLEIGDIFPQTWSNTKFQHIGVNGNGMKNTWDIYTDKKGNQIFLIYKEIQNGAVAKSYMTNGLLIYGEIFAHFVI